MATVANFSISGAWTSKMDLLEFPGPLFLVGMPRSGTKLLRGMLNEHPAVRIPDVETEFFPYWVAEWRRIGPIDSPDTFRKFYRSCLHLTYFRQSTERGVRVDRDAWFQACHQFTPAGVFEGLLRSMLSIPPGDRSVIWGDKSPSYIRHIPLLKREFPSARFIHIVRDVRDYCLSIRKAWGKSVLRAAQRWQDDVSKARSDGKALSSSYMEVRYEDLLLDPRAVLAGVCGFLQIGFDDRVLHLSRAPENRGDAVGLKQLVSTNAGKYQTEVNKALVTQIEMVACAGLRELGYPCGYAGKPIRVPSWKLRLLQAMDGVQLVRSLSRDRGAFRALRSQLKYFKTSGNRQR